MFVDELPFWFWPLAFCDGLDGDHVGEEGLYAGEVGAGDEG